MRERSEQILKIVCIALGLLLVVQLVKAVIHANPLAGVTVPDLPSLPVESNADLKVANKSPSTNAATPALASKTNAPSTAAATNNPATNTAAIAAANTNSANPKASNSTNGSLAATATIGASNSAPTNTVAIASTDTNAAISKVETSTNTLASQSTNANSTNTASLKKPSRKGGGISAGIMAGPMGTKGVSLPPEIEARVDRVTESEILGPVMRPMPMALLGIAGNVAFLRSPSGQTGLVKVGEDLGEIKLLSIGTNRVLIEENGEKKELMMFAGFGGESLLPKSTESSNETTNRN